MFAFTRFSLARQFMVVSLLILLASMLIVGTWVGRQIEEGVLERTAVFTSLYVNSYVSHYLQDVTEEGTLAPEDIETLDRLMSETPLGQEVVSFKVWSEDGRILYSSDPELINQQYENFDLYASFAGQITSEISDLSGPENAYERQYWSELIEIYSPIWATKTGEVIAVSEFYQVPDELLAEIRTAKQQSWLVVGATTAATYLILAGLVGRASNTILAQKTELQEKATQNKQLHDQVRLAAAHTTTLNERFLRRISADLHDGPGQDISLALLRIGSLAAGFKTYPIFEEERQKAADDFDRVQGALDSALTELRHISAGLQMPEIESSSPLETVQRAVRSYERKTQQLVELTVDSLPTDAPQSVKITLYRIIQEALNNGLRHADRAGQQVEVRLEEDKLCVQIRDEGPGFELDEMAENGRLGLIGMRDRVLVLGGQFTIKSKPGDGTMVQAVLPLTVPEVTDG